MTPGTASELQTLEYGKQTAASSFFSVIQTRYSWKIQHFGNI
jgi:hypothetical protein